MCVCDKDYIFLGSRLGNSLLLRLGEKGTVREIIEQAEEGNGEKPIDDIEMEDLTEVDDEIARIKRSRLALDMEEVEVYGSEKKTHFTIKIFGFEVWHALHLPFAYYFVLYLYWIFLFGRCVTVC